MDIVIAVMGGAILGASAAKLYRPQHMPSDADIDAKLRDIVAVTQSKPADERERFFTTKVQELVHQFEAKS